MELLSKGFNAYEVVMVWMELLSFSSLVKEVVSRRAYKVSFHIN